MAAGQAPMRVLLLGTEVTFDAFGTPTYAITGVTTGVSQSVYLEAHGVVSFYLRSIGTTSGGTILIEEADWGPYEAPYSGTWFQLATVAASSFTGGAQSVQRMTLADNAFAYVRVRISATITGGGSILVSMRSRGAM